RKLLREANDLVSRGDHVISEPKRLAVTAKERARALRLEEAYSLVETMPIERIREVTQDRLRLGPLSSYGYTTVADLLGVDAWRLERIPGVGPRTAQLAIAAAHQIAEKVAEEARIQLDPDDRDRESTALLEAVRSYELASRAAGPLAADVKKS